MSIEELSIKLADLMEKETAVLNEISIQEESLQKTLRDSNWDQMEIIISRLSPLSDEMDKIEVERNNVYQKLKSKLNKSETDGFYSITVHMEGETRERCLAGYRKMKVALLRMKGITSGIDQYIRAVGDASKTVLDEVFPHRRGRIYSSTGSARPVHSAPMVLNRQL